jgi:hypothetical protein
MRLGPASLAADPLQPDATEHLNLLSLSTFVPSLNVGPFRLRPEVSGGATYDDNITLSAANKLADWIWTISPRLSAVADHTFEGYGTLLRLDYSPTFVFFNQHTGNNNIEHHADLAGSWVMNKLSLGLRQRFEQTETGVIETGGRLQQREYNTELDTKYKLGEKTSIELNPRLTISETEKQLGYTEYGVDAFLNRQIASKTTGSLGGSGGYVDVEDSPHQIYERALLRLQYAATGKIDLEASAGGEWRQFSDRSATVTPVFGIAAAYRPFERTTITLEARRRDEISSALTNQNYTATGFTLGIRQRVFERVRANLTGSYDNRNYNASNSGVTAVRRDDVFRGRAEVEISLVRHLSMTFFYQYEKDDSNDPTRRFTDNQAGVQGTWRL